MSSASGVSPGGETTGGGAEAISAAEAIAQAVDYALGEHGLDDMGLSTAFTAGIVLEELAEAGFAVVPQCRYEYALGWYAETGRWCPISRATHPWLSEMQRQLADHEGEPDWDGVVVIGRPVSDWAAVSGDKEMSGWTREVPDDPAARRNFVSDDPTEDPDFDPSKWTGTFLSGLISSRLECGACGADWTDDHICGGLPVGEVQP